MVGQDVVRGSFSQVVQVDWNPCPCAGRPTRLGLVVVAEVRIVKVMSPYRNDLAVAHDGLMPLELFKRNVNTCFPKSAKRGF